ncbi:O-antigen ligase family protein [Candidatus Woesebacteria bacterium]|nr:O-antigen ligase family protein [Candidatus Woesebacteria bacterium]
MKYINRLFKYYQLVDYFLLFQIIFLYIFLLIFYEEGSFNKTITTYGSFISIILLQLIRKVTPDISKVFLKMLIVFITGFTLSTIFSRITELSLFTYLFYLSNVIAFLVGSSISKIHKNNTVIYSSLIYLISFIVSFAFFVKEALIRDLFSLHTAFIGPFYWHNQMAGFLLFFVPSVFLVIPRIKNKILKIYIIMSGILLSIFLILTMSRGGWLIYFLTLIYLLFEFRKSSIEKKRLLSIITATFLIFISFLFLNIPKFQTKSVQLARDIFSTQKTTSGNLRVSTYNSSLEMFYDHPLYGVGPGVFGEAMYYYQNKPWLWAKYAHNHYLQILAEGGIITFIGFVYIIFIVFYYYFKKGGSLRMTNKAGSSNKVVLYAIFLGIVSSISHNIIDVDWNYPVLSFLFWFFLGIFLSNLISKKDNNLARLEKHKKYIYLFLCLFLGLSLYLSFYERQIEASNISFLNNDYELSKNYLEKSIKIIPFSYRGYLKLGYANKNIENNEGALSSFKKAANLNQFNADPVFQKYFIQSKTDQLSQEKKEKSITSIIDLNPYAQPFYYTEAYRVFLNSTEKQKSFDIIKSGAEEGFSINQSFEDFRYIYKDQEEFLGNLFDLHMTYALLLKARGETDKSEVAIKNAIQIYENNKDFQNMLNFLDDIDLQEN